MDEDDQLSDITYVSEKEILGFGKPQSIFVSSQNHEDNLKIASVDTSQTQLLPGTENAITIDSQDELSQSSPATNQDSNATTEVQEMSEEENEESNRSLTTIHSSQILEKAKLEMNKVQEGIYNYFKHRNKKILVQSKKSLEQIMIHLHYAINSQDTQCTYASLSAGNPRDRFVRKRCRKNMLEMLFDEHETLDARITSLLLKCTKQKQKSPTTKKHNLKTTKQQPKKSNKMSSKQKTTKSNALKKSVKSITKANKKTKAKEKTKSNKKTKSNIRKMKDKPNKASGTEKKKRGRPPKINKGLNERKMQCKTQQKTRKVTSKQRQKTKTQRSTAKQTTETPIVNNTSTKQSFGKFHGGNIYTSPNENKENDDSLFLKDSDEETSNAFHPDKNTPNSNERLQKQLKMLKLDDNMQQCLQPTSNVNDTAVNYNRGVNLANINLPSTSTSYRSPINPSPIPKPTNTERINVLHKHLLRDTKIMKFPKCVLPLPKQFSPNFWNRPFSEFDIPPEMLKAIKEW